MPTWSWTPGAVKVAVGTAVGLVVGLVVGVLVDGTDLLQRPDHSSSTTRISTGPVSAVDDDPTGEWGFELPVFNSAKSSVDVRLVSFAGVASSITSERAKVIAPGTWRNLRFATTANCDVAPATAGISTVRLRVRATSGSKVTSVPLSGAGNVLLDYYRTICGSGDRVAAWELAGVWSLETAYGTNNELAGHLLLRFQRDGTFTADSEGHLFERHPGVRGTYRTKGDVLTYHVRTGSACLRGDQAHWRVSVLGVESLSMVWVHGGCPAGAPGDAWLLRRVLTDGTRP